MGVLLGAVTALGKLNGALLALGRWLGAGCLALMVAAILGQVWFRYVIGNALAWPDEASRFLMLWMVGLMAATAFRRGGFVAIDMIQLLMPLRVAAVLKIALLCLSLAVLVTGFVIGLSELSGLGARFSLSSLYYPTGLAPLEWAKVPRGWMMMSFQVCMTLLCLVNIELLLRSVVSALGRGSDLPAIPEDASLVGAE